jgi:hypothetical protein
MLTPTQYHVAVKTVKRLQADIDKKEKERATKKHRIEYNVYRPKIQALEAEMSKAIQNVNTEFINFEANQKEAIFPNLNVIGAVKEIVNLMHIAFDVTDLSVRVNSYYYRNGAGDYEGRKISYTPIDTLVRDQYKNIQVFIVRNKKPINKYTLTIQGISLFHNRLDHILPERNSYIQSIDENTNIRQTLKEAPTVEALQKWYDKNKAGLLKDFLKDFLVAHAEIEIQYEEAKVLYKRSEWKALYVELWRDEHIHQGDDEWNDYTAISNILSKNQKDLVLLIGQMKTDEGKKMLERFLKE